MPKNDNNNFIDKNKLKEELKDKTIADSQKQEFVNSLMNEYFLDNDNISFLEENGYKYFTFDKSEDCFCLSNKTYEKCCFKNLKDPAKEDYMSFHKSLLHDKSYEEYISKMTEKYNKQINDKIKDLICSYKDCEEKAEQNSMFDEDLNKNYLISKKFNLFDSLYNMGTNFFKAVDNEMYISHSFCKKHFVELNSTSGETIIFNKSKIIAEYNKFNYSVFLECLKNEFIENYNSIIDEAFKAYMVVNLRQTSKILRSLNTFTKLHDDINNFKFEVVSVESKPSFIINDLISPQISPQEFKTINSVNNVWKDQKYTSMILDFEGKKTMAYFVYLKNDKETDLFFSEWKNMIDNKAKKECFISNCALILSDGIMFKKNWFSNIDDNEKNLLSALSKFRLEPPKNGSEYIKMQFFAGFDKGNNFFNNSQ